MKKESAKFSTFDRSIVFFSLKTKKHTLFTSLAFTFDCLQRKRETRTKESISRTRHQIKRSKRERGAEGETKKRKLDGFLLDCHRRRRRR